MNDPLTFTYPLSALLAIAMPILVGVFLAKKYGLTWKLFLYGAAAFVLAQLAHIPINLVLQKFIPALGPDGNLLAKAVVLSFTAAITEEPARYSVLKGKLSWARSWKEALMFGAGHGGLESILIGMSLLG
ncbi:MAG TPA: YhfC family intramembrane metalloprotease, partial [Anaerolineae bacterium]|nr:YhfC family intramembrane metalloprotease [Anaerolineae bacterium]